VLGSVAAFGDPVFLFLRPGQEVLEVVLALSSTVDGLGLCGCRFPCYEEVVIFVRAFPHCDKLYVQDCVTGGKGSPENLSVDMPRDEPSVVDLDITASSTNESLIDPSGFIEDAELDVPSLSKLAHLWVAVFVDLSGRIPGYVYLSLPTLSLTINHSIHNIDATSVAAGIANHRSHISRSGYSVLEPPHLTKAQIIYHCRTTKTFNTSCRVHLNSILSHRDQFPRLEVVYICSTFRLQQLRSRKKFLVCDATKSPRLPGRRMTHWDVTHQVFLIPLGVS